MNKRYNILLFSGLLAFVYSCSTQKDSVISRNYHKVTTKFNVLFNGEQAFEKGLKGIRDDYQDNFWKRLPIEPITFDDRVIEAPKIGDPGQDFDGDNKKELTPFDKAEEKAVKAIQKHSMNINGFERNTKVDDSYLLLGKARYYTQRFIPAIEAFNYAIGNYPKASLIYDTKIWRAKANLRLDNEELALETLNLLLELDENEETLTDLQRERAHTAMAMAYEKTDTIQRVIEHLTLACKTFKDKDQAARNQFVLGQIYSELNYKDSARMVFKSLAENRRAPRKYRIHANIAYVKNIDKDSASTELKDQFKKLIKNPDNRKYLDQLYYQAGVLEHYNDNTDGAIAFYNKSLERNGDAYQKTYTYESLGNLHFDKQDYLVAGAYYDSVIQNTSKEFETEKRIRRIKRKNKGLIKLKGYEDVVKSNDSILKLVAMSDDERTAYFETYIEQLKKEDEERKQQQLNAQNFGNQFGENGSFIQDNSNKGKWYFYNTQSKGFGKGQFQQVWGNRPLEDNWRWSAESLSSAKEVEDEVEEDLSRYEVSTYVETIPQKPEDIKTLKDDRKDALYQLGLIYKEQFKNNQLAVHNFERLLNLGDTSDLELPINYHLYQLYNDNANTQKAEQSKELILTKYSNSKFAEIIRSPNKMLVSDKKETELEKKYKELYYLYKANKFEDVVAEIDGLPQNVDNSELIPKFVLLRALAIGKYQSKEDYKKALEFVALSYANRIEGEKAQAIIELLK